MRSSQPYPIQVQSQPVRATPIFNSIGNAPRSVGTSYNNQDALDAPGDMADLVNLVEPAAPVAIAPITSVNLDEREQPTLSYAIFHKALDLFFMFEGNTGILGTITLEEFEQVFKLLNSNWSHFNCQWDTIKMLMDTLNTKQNGTISFSKFSDLWAYIQNWHNLFVSFNPDSDESGFIDGQELSQALHQIGYDIPPALICKIEQKYAAAPKGGMKGPCRIPFDRFMCACAGVKKLSDTFRSLDPRKSGSVQMNYEQFLDVYLSLP